MPGGNWRVSYDWTTIRGYTNGLILVIRANPIIRESMVKPTFGKLKGKRLMLEAMAEGDSVHFFQSRITAPDFLEARVSQARHAGADGGFANF